MKPPKQLERVVAFTAIKLYAMHSYLYYRLDAPIIDDRRYDLLCHWLLANYDWVKPYDINDFLDRGALKAGTGFELQVVGQTKDAADALAFMERVMTSAPVSAPDDDFDDVC